MLISQLPQEIKEKALSLQKQIKSPYKKDTDDLGWAFDWEYQKQSNENIYLLRERWKFWKQCHDAKSPNDLPIHIPDYI